MPDTVNSLIPETKPDVVAEVRLQALRKEADVGVGKFYSLAAIRQDKVV
jgi:hypothetical protein